MSRQAVIAVALIIAVIGVGWAVWTRYRVQPVEPEPLATPPAPSETVSEAAAPGEPEPDPLPPLDASDDLAGEALRAAGGGEGPLAAALAQGNLVRRFVGAVNAAAQGRSPATQLGFLAPEQQFRSRREGDALVMDPTSFARYDALVGAISRLDATGLADSYARMEPLFQTAHSELGVEGEFRTVLLQAIDHLAAAPVPSLPIRLADHVEYYAYADPELAHLSEAQKHLLRLGPENQRRIQAKMAQLRDRLGRLR